jgi:hypothetical protein
MGGDSSSDLPSAAILKGSVNYAIWAVIIREILVAKELQEHINPDYETPTDEMIEWEKKDAKVRSIIRTKCDIEPNEVIIDIHTAKEIWQQLELTFKDKGYSLAHSLRLQFFALRYENFTNITSFSIEFKKLVRQLKASGIDLPDRLIITQFITALASAFPTWAQRNHSLERHSPSEVNLQYLTNDITDEIRISGGAVAASDGTVTFAKATKTRKLESKPRSFKKCSYCNKMGHQEEDCWIKNPAKKEKLLARKNKGEGKSTVDDMMGMGEVDTSFSFASDGNIRLSSSYLGL